MAASVAELTQALAPSPGSHGNDRVTVKLVTADTSYPTGGYALTAAQLGLTKVKWGIANILTAAALGGAVDAVLIPQSDGSAKLKLNAAAAEVVNATNIAALVCQVVAFGDA